VGCSQCGKDPIEARGLCQRHYMQWRTGASIPAPLNRMPRGQVKTCSVDGCNKLHKSNGYRLHH